MEPQALFAWFAFVNLSPNDVLKNCFISLLRGITKFANVATWGKGGGVSSGALHPEGIGFRSLSPPSEERANTVFSGPGLARGSLPERLGSQTARRGDDPKMLKARISALYEKVVDGQRTLLLSGESTLPSCPTRVQQPVTLYAGTNGFLGACIDSMPRTLQVEPLPKRVHTNGQSCDQTSSDCQAYTFR